MANLLKQTISIMEDNNIKPESIIFIGRSKNFSCSWDVFESIADREYDSGYGGAEVSQSLKIIFSDGSWLERGEYDGSEWWEYKKTPVIPSEPQREMSQDELFDGRDYS